MKWTATAVWIAQGLTSDQLGDISTDLGDGTTYASTTRVLQAQFDITAAARDGATILASARTEQVLPPMRSNSITV